MYNSFYKRRLLSMTFHIKDPGSAITHFIAMLGAAIATVPLLEKAAKEPDQLHLMALSIFMISMILLDRKSVV